MYMATLWERPNNFALKYIQLHDEGRQQHREYDETKKQIEEDADREILDIKNTYEKKLREEREANMKLKGETGIMRKKVYIFCYWKNCFTKENFRINHLQRINHMQRMHQDLRITGKKSEFWMWFCKVHHVSIINIHKYPM